MRGSSSGHTAKSRLLKKAGACFIAGHFGCPCASPMIKYAEGLRDRNHNTHGIEFGHLSPSSLSTAWTRSFDP